MDAKHKNKKPKQNRHHNKENTSTLHPEETPPIPPPLLTAENTHEQQRLLALQSRLHATTQLGGKGTMRRRKLRRTTPLLAHDLANTEVMRSFVKKFDFTDYGQMESVSFVESNTGNVTTYDSINLMANIKSGMFHFNFSKYKNINHMKKR